MFFDGFSTGKYQAQDCSSAIFNYDVYDYIFMNKTCVKPHLRRPARYVFKCKISRQMKIFYFLAKLLKLKQLKANND